MKLFTGDSKTTTNFSPGKIELLLKDIKSHKDTIVQSIENTPTSYTATEAAKLNCKQRQKMVWFLQQSIKKVNNEAFKRSDISHLKQELENIDISTNTFVRTVSKFVPLDDKIYHPTLGL